MYVISVEVVKLVKLRYYTLKIHQKRIYEIVNVVFFYHLSMILIIHTNIVFIMMIANLPLVSDPIT